MFSKSFGYALRGILVIAFLQNEKRRIHVDEIASRLMVPRFFMSKVLKNLSKHGILDSVKGPYGGFYVNEQTMSTSVYKVFTITDGDGLFRNCALRLQDCNLQNPCPLHDQIFSIRSKLMEVMEKTTISELMKMGSDDFLSSLSSQVPYKKTIPAA